MTAVVLGVLAVIGLATMLSIAALKALSIDSLYEWPDDVDS